FRALPRVLWCRSHKVADDACAGAGIRHGRTGEEILAGPRVLPEPRRLMPPMHMIMTSRNSRPISNAHLGRQERTRWTSGMFGGRAVDLRHAGGAGVRADGALAWVLGRPRVRVWLGKRLADGGLHMARAASAT